VASFPVRDPGDECPCAQCQDNEVLWAADMLNFGTILEQSTFDRGPDYILIGAAQWRAFSAACREKNVAPNVYAWWEWRLGRL